MTEGKIQWHPGFHAALQIELEEDREQLVFEEEHLLGKKPMQIDVVVIKKEKGRKIHKNIGHIFREHNIIEYKSPDDFLGINDFYKTYGYACFYQSDTEKSMEIDPGEITITFVCNHYPRKMLEHVKQERGITVKKYADGIYYLNGDAFPIQLIINHELSKEENYWMQNLRKDLKSGGEIGHLIESYEPRKTSELYQAVMEIIIRANWKETEKEKNMCEALRELFADELQESEEKGIRLGISQGIEQGISQGIEQGIRGLVETCAEFGLTREDTLLRVEQKLSLSREEAEKYLSKCWNDKK